MTTEFRDNSGSEENRNRADAYSAQSDNSDSASGIELIRIPITDT